ncbi:hypothetical protein MMC22_007664 [Lobaria immixta]|nr:hypothetical protein [Lobaria immixta]
MSTPQKNSHHIVVLSLMATGLRQTVSSMKVFMIILSSEKTLTPEDQLRANGATKFGGLEQPLSNYTQISRWSCWMKRWMWELAAPEEPSDPIGVGATGKAPVYVQTLEQQYGRRRWGECNEQNVIVP